MRTKETVVAMYEHAVLRVKDFIKKGKHDPIQAFCSLIGIGFAVVLAHDPKYLAESPRLQGFLALGPQWVWTLAFAAHGLIEAATFLLGGDPPYFQTAPAKNRYYTVCSAVQTLGMFLFGASAALTAGEGLSLGVVFFVTTALGCWVSALWVAGNVSVDRNVGQIKQLRKDAIKGDVVFFDKTNIKR